MRASRIALNDHKDISVMLSTPCLPCSFVKFEIQSKSEPLLPMRLLRADGILPNLKTKVVVDYINGICAMVCY